MALTLLDLSLVALAAGLTAVALVARVSWCRSPLVFFFAGTALFLQVGALKDAWLGMSYPWKLEFKVRILEMIHIGCVGIGYLALRRFQGRFRPLPASKLRVDRLIVVFFTAAAIRWLVADPFLSPFRGVLLESNYFRLLGFFAVPAAVLIVCWCNLARPGTMGHVVAVLLSFAAVMGTSRTPIMYVAMAWLLYLSVRIGELGRNRSLVQLLTVYLLPAIAALLLLVGGLVKGYSTVIKRGESVELLGDAAYQQGVRLGFIDAYENAVFAVSAYPRWFDFHPGESIGAILLGPMPRSVWKAKPYGFSHHLTEAKLGKNARQAGLSLSTSLLGDFWGNGGWISVILHSLALGAVVALLKQIVDRHRSSPAYLGLQALLLFLCFLLPRGDLYTVMQRGLVFFVWMVLLARVVSRPVRREIMGRTNHGGFEPRGGTIRAAAR